MIYDYNVLKDDSGYYVYADKFPEINESFDWNSSHYEEYDNIKLYVGPSGFLVDIDFERNKSNYTDAKMTVVRKKVYDYVEKPYDISSIKYDESGNIISFDEWLGDDGEQEGGMPYFSPLVRNVNDLLDVYKKEVDEALIPKVSVTLNNRNVFPNMSTVMNLKTSKPVVKAENSVTRKEKEGGTVIKVSR